MTIPQKTALIRLARILAFGLIAFVVNFLIENIGIIIPEKYNYIVPVVTAVLSYFDKLIREQQKN